MDDVFQAKVFFVFAGYPGTLLLAFVLIGFAMMWLREANRKRGAREGAHRITLLMAAAITAGLLDLLRGFGAEPVPKLPPYITVIYLPSADWYLARALVTFAAFAAFGFAEWHARCLLRRYFREPKETDVLAMKKDAPELATPPTSASAIGTSQAPYR